MHPTLLSMFCPFSSLILFQKRLCAFARIRIVFVGFLWISTTHAVDAQVDTAYFEALYDTVNIYLDNDLEKAYGKLDFYISESRRANYKKGMLNGLQDLGWWHKELRQYERADSAYFLALAHAKQDGDFEDLGYTYRQMADVSRRAGKSYEMIDRFKQGLASYQKAQDDHWVCKMYNMIGQHLNDIDDHALALEYLEKGVDWCGKINYQEYIAYTLAGAGVVHAKMENYDRADSLYVLALDKLKTFPEDINSINIMNNRAILLKNTGNYKEALAIYNEALLNPNIHPNQVRSLLSNRAEVYIIQRNYEAAKLDIEKAIQSFDESQNLLGLANGYNVLAKAYFGLRDYNNAKLTITKANEYATKASSLDKLKDNFEIQVKMSEELGDHKKALAFQKKYIAIKDSVYNLENARIIEQQQQKFGASIERSENALLKAQLELSKVRRTWLLIGLVGLGAVAFAGISFLYYKRRRDKEIFEKEGQLNKQKIENQELQQEQLKNDLELKKQELMASALQIQSKNEVLAKLNTQISEIETNQSGNNVNLKKISRQINKDLESNTEWDRFIQSFSEVHVDFVKRLNREHPDLSRHQVRLLCLMKMNLSSREIGNILNISSEGVKKARYRLKRKLELSTDQKIEDFLNDSIQAANNLS